MPRLTGFIRKTTLLLAVLVSVAVYPLQALADNPPPGVMAPTGAAAGTYVYNSDTGLWENAYYTWNPVTKETLPKYTQTYTYNPSTGQYDTTTYLYNAAAGQYDAVNLSVTQPPAGAVVIGAPPADPVSSPALTSPTTTASDTNSPANNPGSLGSFDVAGNVTVNNNLTARANSGDALVLANTTAGSALSGNALDMATILNILQSTTSLQGGSVTTFTKDVGDWQGDLVIDPSALSNLGSVTPNSSPSNLAINSKSNGQINNDINLAAGSGNATVAYNTTAGDATTGSADAIANIVNVINSIIGAGQSFVGTININGNLDGDILLPPDTLSALLASNAAPILTTTSDANGNTLKADITDTSSISNNLDLSAKTGSASVAGNTNAGNATSGNASTNITLLNLTGKQIIGSDALLVFVNVMGKWVGMIVNAPSGSTAAALGGGITDNSSLPDNTTINSNTNSSINNNVRASATSGNALVEKNTTAGNAASGNASVGLNLLNISTSSLSLSNWLGILFINVFGSWNGSFGIDTAAGNPPLTGGGSGSDISEAVKSVKVFSFIPKVGSSFSLVPVVTADSPSSSQDNTNQNSTVLGAVTNGPTSGQTNHKTSPYWVAGSLFALAGVLSAEEAVLKRKEARAKFREYIHSITVQPLKKY